MSPLDHQSPRERGSAPVGRPIKLLLLAAVLAGVWLLWSGHFDSKLLLGLGLASVLLVVAIASRMRIVDEEGAPLRLPLRAPVFIPWLFWQIVKANLDVARRILSPGLPIQPQMIRVKATQERDLGRVVYANSITLTPGTVSVDVDGDEIVVHALSDDAARELRTGEMDRMVTWAEGRDR